MVEMVDAVVVRGKFHERLKDGTRRVVKPDSDNPKVKVTLTQLVAFKGTLLPAAVAKAQADANAQMEKAMTQVAEAEAKTVGKVKELEDKAGKAAVKAQ